jgi:hypothetical protein
MSAGKSGSMIYLHDCRSLCRPFVLLAGTVLVLVLLVFGSISLLSSVGGHELPSTLLATAVNGKRE